MGGDHKTPSSVLMSKTKEEIRDMLMADEITPYQALIVHKTKKVYFEENINYREFVLERLYPW